MSSKSKKNNKFNALGSSVDRKANNRIERQVAEERPLMLFSFKDFQYNSQTPRDKPIQNGRQQTFLHIW